MKVVVGGVIEKDGKFLLVQEAQKICANKWNIPAGGLDEDESIIEGATREIYEETGCKVEITGLLEIMNENLENTNLICIFFDTKLIDENIKFDKKEIMNAKWFTYNEILNMKDDLRADGYFLSTLQNKINNKIIPLDIIKIKGK